MKAIRIIDTDDQRAMYQLKDRFGRKIGFQALVHCGRVIEGDKQAPVSLEEFKVGQRVYYVVSGQFRGGSAFGSNHRVSPALRTQEEARQWALEQALIDKERTVERLQRASAEVPETLPDLSGGASKTVDQKFDDFISSL